MRKLTQLELLEEGFLDTMRRAGGIARAAAKGVAKGIYAMDPGRFDTMAAPFKSIASPIAGAMSQIKKDDPVSFLKEELKTYRSIELVKVISQKTQNANIPVPGKKISTAANKTNTAIKNLMGTSKTVTIINFLGTVYRKGTDRQYKPYGEAVAVGSTQANRDNNDAVSSNTSETPPEAVNSSETPPETVNTSETPPESNAKLMAAEVFRTSRGLVLGDIYDPGTGDIISEYREKQQPFSFESSKAYFFANQQPPISPYTTELSVQDATSFIKYLFLIKSKNYDTAQPAEKSRFEAILSNATAASANVKVSDIKSVAKQTRIAENTHVSQKVLLEQISRL